MEPKRWEYNPLQNSTWRGSPLTCLQLTPGNEKMAWLLKGSARHSAWLHILNFCFSKQIVLHPFPKVPGVKFSQSHSQHGNLLFQCGNPNVLLKNSWSPMMDHKTPLIFLGCNGWPANDESIEPFSKGSLSGPNLGWWPDANAVKDQASHFQMASQVPFVPHDLGKQASNQWLSKVLWLLSKLPQEKTMRLSLLVKSTPSPWTYIGMQKSSQPFVSFMGWPTNLSSPDFATPFQKSARLPFPKLNRWKKTSG